MSPGRHAEGNPSRRSRPRPRSFPVSPGAAARGGLSGAGPPAGPGPLGTGGRVGPPPPVCHLLGEPSPGAPPSPRAPGPEGTTGPQRRLRCRELRSAVTSSVAIQPRPGCAAALVADASRREAGCSRRGRRGLSGRTAAVDAAAVCAARLGAVRTARVWARLPGFSALLQAAAGRPGRASLTARLCPRSPRTPSVPCGGKSRERAPTTLSARRRDRAAGSRGRGRRTARCSSGHGRGPRAPSCRRGVSFHPPRHPVVFTLQTKLRPRKVSRRAQGHRQGQGEEAEKGLRPLGAGGALGKPGTRPLRWSSRL